MKKIVLAIGLFFAPVIGSASTEMSAAHSRFLYKTLVKYTKQSGTIELSYFACRGNGLKICSYSPNQNTSGSFSWIPTTLAVTMILEQYVTPYQEAGVWVYLVKNLSCTPNLCSFN